MKHGVDLVYVGARVRHIRAAASRLVYHVAPLARFVRVDPRDVDELIESGEFVVE